MPDLDVNAAATTEQRRLLSRLTSVHLPPSAVDGLDFPQFVKWWIAVLAQLAIADLVPGVGGKDGTGTAGATLKWQVKEAGAFLFSCVTDTDLYLGASAHMVDGIALRNFIFNNCAPTEAVEEHLRAAVTCLDKPTFRHSSLQAWFREIEYCLAVCTNFAKAAFTADHAMFTRTEKGVITVLGLPPQGGESIVPWDYHTAIKMSDAKCDTIKQVLVIANKSARFQNIVGQAVANSHVSSVSSILPSRSGATSFYGGVSAVTFKDPLCPEHSPSRPCTNKTCRHRHALTDSESSLFGRIAAAEARTRALENSNRDQQRQPAQQHQQRARRTPADIAALGRESCNNFTAGKCSRGDKCYRKHDKPPPGSGGAVSSIHPSAGVDAAVIAAVVSQMTAAGWSAPSTSSVQMPAASRLAIGAPTAATSSVDTSRQAASLLQVLMRNGSVSAVDSPITSDIVSSIDMDVTPAYGFSAHGSTNVGETPRFQALFDSGSSIIGTSDINTVNDVRWFPEPVPLTTADADSKGAVALGVGAAHLRLVNDRGELVAIRVVLQLIVPCFAEDIFSAASLKRAIGAKVAYKPGDDVSEHLHITSSGEMIPIATDNDRDFVAVTKLTWNTTVPTRHRGHFGAQHCLQAPAPAPAPPFSALPPGVVCAILDVRIGCHDERRGANHIKAICSSAGVNIDRRTAAIYRDAADQQIEADTAAQRAHMAALFKGIPRPYSLQQAAEISFFSVTKSAPTLSAMSSSGKSLTDWASMPDPSPGIVDNEAWRIESGIDHAEHEQGLADIAVLADVLIQEAADRLPQSLILNDMYSAVATARGDLPGCDVNKPAAHQAVVAAVHEHCRDLDVPFNNGHIIDLIGAPGGVEAVVKRVAQGLASDAEASPLDAEPPPQIEILKLRTCLVNGPPGIGAPNHVAQPTWPVSKAAKKIIDAMPIGSVLRTLQQLPPAPVTPEELAAKVVSGGAMHNRNEVQYMRLRAARMGTYCWHSQHDVLLRLHEKLGHRNWRDTAAAARAQGYRLDSVAEAFCDACLRVKTTRHEPTRDRPAHDESDLLTRWHVDVSGPHTASRLGAHRYVTVFVAKGGTTLLCFSPNMLNFQDIQRRFIDDVRKMQKDMPHDSVVDVHAASWRDGLHVTTDGAKYFTSAPAQLLWAKEKFVFHVSAPLTPALNGAAERKIRTLGSSAKCMLLFRDQPANLWPEAWRCARAVDDLMPTNSDPLRLSPFTQRTGRPPDLSSLHPAFCPVYVWQNSADRDKEAPGARRGVYIGPDDLTDCCAVLIEGATRAQRVTSRHLRLIEDLPPRVSDTLIISQHHVVEPQGAEDFDCIDIDQVIHEQQHPDPDTINLDYYGSSGVSFAVPTSTLPGALSTALQHFDLATTPNPHLGKVSSVASASSPRSLPTVVDTALSPEDVLWLADFSAKTRGDDPDLHYNFSAARRCEKFGHLVEPAAIKELTGLLKEKGCLEQIMLDSIDEDARVHRCLPLFHPKYKNQAEDDDDSAAVFDRYKCRITFNGSSQIKGLDYLRSETNQPRFETWRLHMGTTCGATVGTDGHYVPPTDADDNYTLGGDVPMAYTNATPTSTVLVELPRDVYHLALKHGLVQQDPSGRCICRVLKCQYGQCDAGRLWENVWVEDMLARGFTQSTYERCLFYRGNIRVLCHTDDFLARGNKAQCLAFAAEMDKRWGDCKCTPFPKEILSWNISYGEHNAITLSALGQINGMLKSLDMENTFRRYTPMPSAADPSTWKSTEHCGVTKIVQSMNGSLNHIAQTTRPDMSFACNKFGSCQYMPSAAVIPSLRHSYKYMHTTKHWGLAFDGPFRNPGSGTNVLQVWVDASDGDCAENKSQTGFLIGYNGGASDWGSHVQKTTSLCTGESELKASCKAARSAVFLIKLLSEFGYPPIVPVTMHEDNTTAIKWSLPDGPSLSDKNKHVDRQYFYVQQLQTQTPPLLNMVHCPTELQRADLLTKNLGRAVHNRLCDMIFVDTAAKA